MKKIIVILALLWAVPVLAQVTVPNTFVAGTRILASEMNANFDALESAALNRAGGTITGNISVDSGITVDGVDVGAVLGGSGTPTFEDVTTTDDLSVGDAANVVGSFTVNTNKLVVNPSSGDTTIAGTLTVGSGSVQLTTASGKIQAISSTYFESLDGTNLTGLAKLGSNNTYTARNDFKTYAELKSTANPSGGSLTYDLSVSSHFETAATGDATITISNAPSPTNGVLSFSIAFTGDGTQRTYTWPASVKWDNNIALTQPTATSSRIDTVTLVSYDLGTTWIAYVTGRNIY